MTECSNLLMSANNNLLSQTGEAFCKLDNLLAGFMPAYGHVFLYIALFLLIFLIAVMLIYRLMLPLIIALIGVAVLFALLALHII